MARRILLLFGALITLGESAVPPNSDPNYRALRDAALGKSVRVSNLRIERDAGVFLLKNGLVTFAAPVLDRVTTAVFSGDGEFQFMPALPIEVSYLKSLTGKQDVSEPFDALALQFTDGTYDEIMKAAQPAELDPKARGILQDYRKRARHNTENPRSGLEADLTGESVVNLDTDALANLYNPGAPGFFRAFIFGKKHNDLRFILRPLGALPQMMAPEEVALLNLDPGGTEEGIWYLSHALDEMRANRASSEEDKRIIDAEHYRIENVIKGTRLTAVADLTFKALREGDRVLSFGLLPSLRVTRVAFGERDIGFGFIQENRKDDGAFAAVLPEPLVKDKSYKIRIEYSGDKVLSNEGGGNFSVGARTSWYPSLGAFNDYATFDLTFKVPRNFTLVSVGHRVEEHREGDLAVSQWVSKVPLAVAGFNYGQFKRKDLADAETKYAIEGYATSELPGYLKEFGEEIMSTSPSALTNKALAETQAALKIFTRYFGESPYGRIAITQQPELAFGQSWPTLVYLPIIAYLDSTQRWNLFGINNRLTEFIQEVTPHEVAHQWWGHIVGWASYHDQWLSEGFADFSAGLFVHLTEPKPDKFLKFLDRNRERILQKNNYGKRPNDAGPIWMGARLNTFKNAGAYSNLVYPKGGFIVHMLRMMMQDPKTGDQAFIAMMRDFVKTFFNRNASTESFMKVVDRHMLPAMDLQGNKSMAWFFLQWVYGTDVPRYRLDYTLTGEGKDTVLAGKITQSEVSDSFTMPVALYGEFDGRMIRLGRVPVVGNTTRDFKTNLPQRPKRVMINAMHDVLAVENVSSGK